MHLQAVWTDGNVSAGIIPSCQMCNLQFGGTCPRVTVPAPRRTIYYSCAPTKGSY